jgi:hypothetical protein
MGGILQAGLDGLHQAESRLERASSRLSQLPVSLSGEVQDVVDISAEAVEILIAKNQFQASLKIIETGAEVAESTLDLLG